MEDIAEQIRIRNEKVAAINAGDYSLLDTESRWTIWMWWSSGKIKRDTLPDNIRTKILDIVDSCKESL